MDEIEKLTVQTVVNITPQTPVVTEVDAPWVNVTSVNGMTGDVIVTALIEEFVANRYYVKDSVVAYNGGLYVAKENFTAGATFDVNDWNVIQASEIDWDDILNKPNFATVATTGDYGDLSNTPSLATVATSGDYDDLTDKPNLATVATSGDYGDLSNVPTVVSAFTNDVNYLKGVDSVDVSSIATDVSGARIISQTITNDKIASGAITSDKIYHDFARTTETSYFDSTNPITWQRRVLLDGVVEYSGRSTFNFTIGANDWGNYGGELPTGVTYDSEMMTFTGIVGCSDGAIVSVVVPPVDNTTAFSATFQNKHNSSLTKTFYMNLVLRIYPEEES